MDDNELIQWYKRVFDEYPSVGLLAFIREVRRLDATALEQAAAPAIDSFMLLEALKMAYRKHHLGDDSIGWNELSDHMLNALCEAMGDKGYQRWLEVQCPANAAGEEE